MTRPQYPPVDPGNHLLGPCPAVLTTSPVMTSDGGTKLALTVRTNSVTLTVLLDRFDVAAWADQLQRDKARMGTA